jgi:hypothetical protein
MDQRSSQQEYLDHRAIGLAFQEMKAGRANASAVLGGKYGFLIERGSYEKCLRILVEEVGKCARAIDDIDNALRTPTENEHPTVAELTVAGEKMQAAREHLLEEIVQVAATALRWASAEIGKRR